jgi:hypothetical protein
MIAVQAQHRGSKPGQILLQTDVPLIVVTVDSHITQNNEKILSRHMHHFLFFMEMGKLLMRVSRHKDPLVFHDPSEKNAARIIPAAFSFAQ